MKLFKVLLLTLITSISSCQNSKLIELGTFPKELQEVSAAEDVGGDIIWTLEDHGNTATLYAIHKHTDSLQRTVTIVNAKNKDWEDLTKDPQGNLYIGDFGNNKGKRKTYTIYKVTPNENDSWEATSINFTLPKKLKNSDFEGFFFHEGFFYLFTKENGKASMIQVDSRGIEQEAKISASFNLKGGNNKITSAAISNDGKQVVLLNHDKIWKLSGFKKNQFFNGTIERILLNHDTQKEGICFGPNNEIYMTDERKNLKGGKLYEYKL